jgi:hypothetical protein
MADATSTSKLLPVPGAGDVKACSGAAVIDRRSRMVRRALSATERSAGATKGKSPISPSSSCSVVLHAQIAGFNVEKKRSRWIERPQLAGRDPQANAGRWLTGK